MMTARLRVDSERVVIPHSPRIPYKKFFLGRKGRSRRKGVHVSESNLFFGLCLFPAAFEALF